MSSSDTSGHERRRERHHRRSRKYDDNKDPSQEVKDERAVDAPSESKKSSHRSHRESDKDREGVRSSHRSHRSKEERSKDVAGETRTSRKRTKSPESGPVAIRSRETIDNVKLSESRYKEIKNEPTSSTRKRRDRVEEDSHHDQDRKRSKIDYPESAENKENQARSRHSKRDGTDASSKHDSVKRSQGKPVEKPAELPKEPELDHHELERAARNRERLLKELQRREAMEGKPTGGKTRDNQVNGRAGGIGRRVSYKYEDEETNEARATRVEKEREAGRWS